MCTGSKNIITPQIALSSKYSQYPNPLVNFALSHGFEGIEYSILSEAHKDLYAEYSILKELAESNLEVRYHMPFKTVELAHQDPYHAEKSTNYFKECLDVLNNLGGGYAIIHIGLGYKNNPERLSYKHALKNMERVVDYGINKNVTVCLENLTVGFTSEPSSFLDLLTRTGALATVDIGHVVSSPAVQEDIVSAEEFIFTVLPYTCSAHVYDREINNEPFHIAPGNKNSLKSRLEALLQGNCNWWVIELEEAGDILHTADFAREIINAN